MSINKSKTEIQGKIRDKQNNYYDKNREAWNEYQREYTKKRYAEDDEYRKKIKEYGKERRNSIKNPRK